MVAFFAHTHDLCRRRHVIFDDVDAALVVLMVHRARTGRLASASMALFVR